MRPTLQVLNRIRNPASSSETRIGSRGPSASGWARRSCPLLLDSSLGVHQRSPLRQYRCRASTPGWAEARPSARSSHTPNAFRPCRSSRLRRFAPLDTQQVCCTLHPAMGFATFPVRLCPLPEGSELGLAVPAGAPPFEAFPSAAGRRASPPVDSLSPLFPVSGLGLARVATFEPSSFCRSLGLRALFHREVRCGLLALPPPSCPMLPWAWFPGWFVDTCSRRRTRGLAMVGPAPVRRPRRGRPWVIPPWSEDRAGAARGKRALRRPARGQAASASDGSPDSGSPPRRVSFPIAAERPRASVWRASADPRGEAPPPSSPAVDCFPPLRGGALVSRPAALPAPGSGSASSGFGLPSRGMGGFRLCPRPRAPWLRGAPSPLARCAGSGLPGTVLHLAPGLRRQPGLPSSMGVTLLARAEALTAGVR
jgi:hypothetical protein